MSSSNKNRGKKRKIKAAKQPLDKRKKGLLRLDSDYDFFKAFKEDSESETSGVTKKELKNRHGIKVLDETVAAKNILKEKDADEDFQAMLERSFAEKKPGLNPRPVQVSVKKRLKRYPPVEKQLDLHGFTAIRAQAKARSFIQTCKVQGLFTIRIVVGKGLHSDIGPVLPDVIEDLAVQMKKEGSVIWFEWENKLKSKSGALVIYLKQFDQYD